MLKALSKQSLQTLLVRFVVVAVLASIFAYVSPVRAAQITGAEDTMTRLREGVEADHSIVFVLPASANFDITDDTDAIEIDFPETAAFTTSGTWDDGDFTFNDGTPRTILSTTAGAGPQAPDCTGGSGGDDVAVTVDTTALTFGFTPCGAFTTSGDGATVTITIDGTATDGLLTNPATEGSYTIVINHDDEGVVAANSTEISIAIVEDDTVTITASVDASLTFDIDVAVSTATENNPTTNPVDLGTLTSGSVTTSNNTTVNSIFMDIATNATDGFVVTVINTDTVVDLASTGTPTDTISAVAVPGTTAVAAGTEGFGICVVGTPSTTGGTISTDAEYDGDGGGCTAADSDNVVGVPPSSAGSPDTIVSATAPVAGGDIEVAVKAAISAVTEAHSDYTDALRFIATATF